MRITVPPAVERDAAAAQLLDVLRTASCRLRMNEMAIATGMSVARVGVSLQILERRGDARFAAGRWTVTDRGRAA